MTTNTESIPKYRLLQRGKYHHLYGKTRENHSRNCEGANNHRFCINLYPILGNRSWLKERYIDKEMTLKAIAEEVCSKGGGNCTRRSVRRALEYHRIKIREWK